MTLSRGEVSKGLPAELEAFERLVRSLSPSEIATPSRCAGWTVGDVAAHVVGTMSDIVAGRIEGQGTPEVTERQVLERRGRTAAELADELVGTVPAATALLGAFDDAAWDAPSPGGYDFTLGAGVEALWYDTYVHGDDIRACLGLPSERGDGLRASVCHVADLLTGRGWGPVTLALTGMPEIPVSGGGRQLTGDPLDFVLVATGRADPATMGLAPDINVYG